MNCKSTITSEFWTKYRNLVRREMIPYQWNVLNDTADIKIEKERNDNSIPSEKSHAIENFRIAAGQARGTHYGWVFQDSDVYKWLEAVAYSLRERMDKDLEAKSLEIIDLIAGAQEEDGYLDTYFTIMAPDYKYKSLWGSHELYCAGHFIEAAVAYNEATGNKKVLDIAERLAQNIDSNFGPEENKIHGFDGHEEIEVGLLRLYHVTDNTKYLNLAKYFLLERGKNPDFFREQKAKYNGPNVLGGIESMPDSYFQNHKPVLEQETAEGHAVRLVYLCTALADLAATTNDKEIFSACKKLWKNITEKRMFITGGIGSTVIGESFTLDYDLPNDTMYCETCAAIGLIFLARQMLRMEPDGEYADFMERALYNCALAGMALDGKHFFYVNPLEVNPLKSKKDPTKSHVKPVRPSWLGCACCPPNLARMITSLDDYIYTVTEDHILLNQYVDSTFMFERADGTLVIQQSTEFPWDENISIKVQNSTHSVQKTGIRIPAWTDDYTIMLNGTAQQTDIINGYVYVESAAGENVTIDLHFSMDIHKYYANPKVSEDIGKVAIGRGPFIYCLEGADNGDDLHCLSLSANPEFEYKWAVNMLGGIGTIQANGCKLKMDEESDLYRMNKPEKTAVLLKYIPYFSWANRGENEMTVWIRDEE